MSPRGDVMPRSRRFLRLGGHKAPSQVEAAVERVAEADAPPPAPDFGPYQGMTIPVHPDPVPLKLGMALDIHPPANPLETVLLIRDSSDGPWRAVLLPPGSTWELHARAKAAAGLWSPPGSKRTPS